jgi:hypothetical protein
MENETFKANGLSDFSMEKIKCKREGYQKT